MNLPDLMEKYYINLIVIYGSRSNQTSTDLSDFDIAILAKNSLDLNTLSQLRAALAKEFNFPEDKVDLVEIIKTSPLLQSQVAKTGKVLIGREADFLKFRILAWRRYLDTAKLRRLREEYLRKTYAQ